MLLCSFRCGQFFQPKLKLFELTVQLLARAAENHPPVLLDDQFQMFDLPAVAIVFDSRAA